MNALKMSLSQKEAELSSMREQLQLTTAELERRVNEGKRLGEGTAHLKTGYTLNYVGTYFVFF